VAKEIHLALAVEVVMFPPSTASLLRPLEETEDQLKMDTAPKTSLSEFVPRARLFADCRQIAI
jgi:hypothetical protein